MKNIFLNDYFTIPGYKLLEYMTMPYQYNGTTVYEIYGAYRNIETGRIDHYFISFKVEKHNEGKTEGFIVTNWSITLIMDVLGQQAPLLSNNQNPSTN
ncbi:MAG: hypothetical protein SGJ00_11330 [bacterium]|nr:hypothetical protein [bacterium]